MLTAVLFVVGLVMLIFGSELLVRGASRLAAAVGISPLVVGLTVVALGTSSPELAVSVQSAYSGQSELAVGNVVGSNILNVLLILGVAAVIAPLEVPQKIIRFDVPLMIFLSAVVWMLVADGTVNRWDGVLLSAGAVGYIAFCIIQSRKESSAVHTDYAEEFPDLTPGPTGPKFVLVQLGAIALGLALLIVGSGWMVEGAVAFARWLKISELVIGLTVVSIGTSLPEIATTVTASLKGERDIAVGNVIGSNICNILAVLGLTALVAPEGVTAPPQTVSFDIPVMLAVAIACLPIFFNGGRITRWEGAIFFAYYIAYTAYVFLAATQSVSLPAYRSSLVFFALPLTVLTLLIVTARNLRPKRPDGAG